LVFYLLAVFVLALAFYATPISKEEVARLLPGLAKILGANPFVAASIFLLVSTALAFFAFPSMPVVYMAAGFYMGGPFGGLVVLLGSAMGGLSAFLFYRQQVRQNLQLRSGQGSSVKLWLTLFGLRLSPLVPAPLANFFAAVMGVSPFQYLTTSLLGGAPLVFFYAHLGQQGQRFLSGATLHWYELSGFVLLFAISTLLSAMGPWSLVLSQIKRLKEASDLRALPLQPATGS